MFSVSEDEPGMSVYGEKAVGEREPGYDVLLFVFYSDHTSILNCQEPDMPRATRSRIARNGTQDVRRNTSQESEFCLAGFHTCLT